MLAAKLIGLGILAVVVLGTALWLPSFTSKEIRFTSMNIAMHQQRQCVTVKADIEVLRFPDKVQIKVNGFNYPTLTVVDLFNKQSLGVVDTDGVYRILTFSDNGAVTLKGNDVSVLFSNDVNITLEECSKKRN